MSPSQCPHGGLLYRHLSESAAPGLEVCRAACTRLGHRLAGCGHRSWTTSTWGICSSPAQCTYLCDLFLSSRTFCKPGSCLGRPPCRTARVSGPGICLVVTSLWLPSPGWSCTCRYWSLFSLAAMCLVPCRLNPFAHTHLWREVGLASQTCALLPRLREAGQLRTRVWLWCS